jgi:Cell division protein FtsQ
VAEWLGAVRRRLLSALIVVAALAAGYWFLLRGETVEPRLLPTQPTSVIGAGSDAIGVSPGGLILTWLPAPEEGSLPGLPLAEPPENGRLSGPVLQQAHVLGAAPAELRPYIESSFYGDSGVDVVLEAGVELRFGDASQAVAKWQAVATVLADPTVTTLDYIDVLVPSRPAIGGSGHTLPPPP